MPISVTLSVVYITNSLDLRLPLRPRLLAKPTSSSLPLLHFNLVLLHVSEPSCWRLAVNILRLNLSLVQVIQREEALLLALSCHLLTRCAHTSLFLKVGIHDVLRSVHELSLAERFIALTMLVKLLWRQALFVTTALQLLVAIGQNRVRITFMLGGHLILFNRGLLSIIILGVL